MAEDWFADVRKYVADADEAVVKKIVSYLGIALRNRDSSLVSFSDPEEVGRVRERFLRKKLGLTEGDDVLGKGLDAVRDLMSGDRTKNRVTVYYLLADWFGKLDLFGGSSSAPGGFSFGSLGGAAAAAGLAGASAEPVRAVSVDPEPVSAMPPPQAAASAPTPADPPPAQTAYDPGPDGDDDGGGGIPGWLKWLLVLAALVALFLVLRSCMADRDAAADGNLAGEDAAASANLN